MRAVRPPAMPALLAGLVLSAAIAPGCLEATPGVHEADALSESEPAADVGPDAAPDIADSGASDSGGFVSELPLQGFFDFVIEAEGDRQLGASDACYSFELLNGDGERVTARGSATGLAAAGRGGDGGPDWGEAEVVETPRDWTDPEAWETSSSNKPICSSHFGFASWIQYVMPCEASPGRSLNTLRYWVNALCETGTASEGDCVPYPDFVNPCGAEGCVVSAICVPDEDTEIRVSY